MLGDRNFRLKVHPLPYKAMIMQSSCEHLKRKRPGDRGAKSGDGSLIIPYAFATREK